MDYELELVRREHERAIAEDDNEYQRLPGLRAAVVVCAKMTNEIGQRLDHLSLAPMHATPKWAVMTDNSLADILFMLDDLAMYIKGQRNHLRAYIKEQSTKADV